MGTCAFDATILPMPTSTPASTPAPAALALKPPSLWRQTTVIFWRILLLKRRRLTSSLLTAFFPLYLPAILLLAFSDSSQSESPSLTGGVRSSIVHIATSILPTRVLDQFGAHAPPLLNAIPDQLAIFARIIIAFNVVLFSPHAHTALIDLVLDKEKKLKESMLIQGLSSTALWLASYLYYLGVALSASTLLTLIIVPFFPYTNSFLLFSLVLLYDISTITFSMALAPFFSTVKSSERVLTFLSFLFFFLPEIVFYFEMAPSELVVLICAFFLYPYGFMFAVLKLNTLENNHIGANWGNLFRGDGIGWYLVVMVLSSCFYVATTLYLDEVVPQPYGAPQPWDFPIRRLRTWLARSRSGYAAPARQSASPVETRVDGDTPGAVTAADEDVEPDPACLPLLLSFRGIRKVYPKNEVALDGVSIKMYETEIFALLGHNGAGKSTLVNILTGLCLPTEGGGTLCGFDIIDNMSAIRQVIGFCPQHDVLSDDLTVHEHLLLAAGIRGLWGSDLSLLQASAATFGLGDKLDEKVSKLSGGQRRKVSILMSMIGDPKILILDEPTNGMDAVSRREFWEMLRSQRARRLTLFTTHLMDEADTVADRKAILTKGRIRCSGTSMFLKKKFGIGYHLDIVRERDDDEAVEAAVKKACPGITRVSSENRTSQAMRFVIPMTETYAFPSMFDDLARLQKKGAIGAYGLSMPTLEEVFLKSEEFRNKTAATVEIDREADLPGHQSDDLKPLLNDFRSVDTKIPISIMAQISILSYYRFLMLRRNLFYCIAAVVPTLLFLYFAVVTLQPLRDGDISAITSVWFLALLLSGLPFTFVRESVVDRQNGTYSLLKLCGVRSLSLWGAYWMPAMVVGMVAVVVTVFIVAILDLTPFWGVATPMFVCGLIGYMASVTIMIYFGMDGDKALETPVILLHTLLSIFNPLYTFPGICFWIAYWHVKAFNGGIDPLNVAFFFDIRHHMVTSLLAMILQSAVCIIALTAFDGNLPTRGDLGEFKVNLAGSDALGEEGPGEVDEDVANERSRVILPDCNDDVAIKRVHKFYPVSKRRNALDTKSQTVLQRLISCIRPPRWLAVNDVTVSCSTGETLAILGPNGAGKSTLMAIAIGDVLPDSGRVAITVDTSRRVSPRNAAARHRVGYCPQADALWPTLTCIEHLALFARLKNFQRNGIEELVRKLIGEEHAGKKVADVSGGAKRKTAFGIALTVNAGTLFLDEPSAGLDPKAKRQFWDIVIGMHDQMATILTTHSMDEAEALSNKIAIMVNGKIVRLGSPQHLKSRFGRTYLLELHTALSSAAAARAEIESTFPGAIRKDAYDEVWTRYEVPVADVQQLGGLGRAFHLLEAMKGGLVEDYTFGQATLEMIFLEVAKLQAIRDE
ncbi:ATP-binding cassette sub- A member 5 [Irineochytrium annulatum]|nr:ATP-binding cassette sub- A member 5 [Irineochytrium annulatum]